MSGLAVFHDHALDGCLPHGMYGHITGLGPRGARNSKTSWGKEGNGVDTVDGTCLSKKNKKILKDVFDRIGHGT